MSFCRDSAKSVRAIIQIPPLPPNRNYKFTMAVIRQVPPNLIAGTRSAIRSALDDEFRQIYYEVAGDSNIVELPKEYLDRICDTVANALPGSLSAMALRHHDSFCVDSRSGGKARTAMGNLFEIHRAIFTTRDTLRNRHVDDLMDDLSKYSLVGKNRDAPGFKNQSPAFILERVTGLTEASDSGFSAEKAPFDALARLLEMPENKIEDLALGVDALSAAPSPSAKGTIQPDTAWAPESLDANYENLQRTPRRRSWP